MGSHDADDRPLKRRFARPKDVLAHAVEMRSEDDGWIEVWVGLEYGTQQRVIRERVIRVGAQIAHRVDVQNVQRQGRLRMPEKSRKFDPVIIVWDLDEVLIDCSGSMCRQLNPVFGTRTSPDEWTDLDFWKYFTSSKKAFERAMIEHQVYERCELLTSARCMIDRLANEGVWRQMIVTGRGLHPTAAKMTAASLVQNGMRPYFERVIVVDDGASKLPALQSIVDCWGPIAAYIEDNPLHAQAAVDQKLAEAVFLLDKPWNRQVPCGAIRVRSLQQIVDILGECYRPIPPIEAGMEIDESSQEGLSDPEMI